MANTVKNHLNNYGRLRWSLQHTIEDTNENIIAFLINPLTPNYNNIDEWRIDSQRVLCAVKVIWQTRHCLFNLSKIMVWWDDVLTNGNTHKLSFLIDKIHSTLGQRFVELNNHFYCENKKGLLLYENKSKSNKLLHFMRNVLLPCVKTVEEMVFLLCKIYGRTLCQKIILDQLSLWNNISFGECNSLDRFTNWSKYDPMKHIIYLNYTFTRSFPERLLLLLFLQSLPKKEFKEVAYLMYPYSENTLFAFICTYRLYDVMSILTTLFNMPLNLNICDKSNTLKTFNPKHLQMPMYYESTGQDFYLPEHDDEDECAFLYYLNHLYTYECLPDNIVLTILQFWFTMYQNVNMNDANYCLISLVEAMRSRNLFLTPNGDCVINTKIHCITFPGNGGNRIKMRTQYKQMYSIHPLYAMLNTGITKCDLGDKMIFISSNHDGIEYLTVNIPYVPMFGENGSFNLRNTQSNYVGYSCDLYVKFAYRDDKNNSDSISNERHIQSDLSNTQDTTIIYSNIITPIPIPITTESITDVIDDTLMSEILICNESLSSDSSSLSDTDDDTETDPQPLFNYAKRLCKSCSRDYTTPPKTPLIVKPDYDWIDVKLIEDWFMGRIFKKEKKKIHLPIGCYITTNYVSNLNCMYTCTDNNTTCFYDCDIIPLTKNMTAISIESTPNLDLIQAACQPSNLELSLKEELYNLVQIDSYRKSLLQSNPDYFTAFKLMCSRIRQFTKLSSVMVSAFNNNIPH